jgi:hypothetical protein
MVADFFGIFSIIDFGWLENEQCLKILLGWGDTGVEEFPGIEQVNVEKYL